MILRRKLSVLDPWRLIAVDTRSKVPEKYRVLEVLLQVEFPRYGLDSLELAIVFNNLMFK